MLKQEPQVSIAVVKVNFMDRVKNAQKIRECKSKAWNTEYKDKSIGVICEISDGRNLNVQFTDTGVENMTEFLIGVSTTVRFSKEQWQQINARFHTMEALGAYIELEVDGTVTYGDLVVNGEEVQSHTIYCAKVRDIQAMEIAKVGTPCAKDEYLEKARRDKAARAAKSEEIRAQNRAARNSTKDVTNTERKSISV